MPKPHLARPAQRIAQHGIGFLRQIVGRENEIGFFIIEHVDRISFDELDQFQRLAALDLDRFYFLLLQQDIIALGHLIALEDFLGVDGADAGHHLLIFDRLAAGLVNLTEGHGRAGLGGGVDFYRDRDQGQTDLTLPICTCSHGRTSSSEARCWRESSDCITIPVRLTPARVSPASRG